MPKKLIAESQPHQMNHPKNFALKVVLIYLLCLSLTAGFNVILPVQSEGLVKLLFPSDIGRGVPPDARYRLILFFAATITLLISSFTFLFSKARAFPLVAIKRMSWGHFGFVACTAPTLWFFYPFLALCPQCFTANDFFYFFLTVFFFVGLSFLLQVIFLKIKFIGVTNDDDYF